MLKFFHSESKTIVSAAAIVGVLSFASRLVGLVRDRILAGAFGAGDVLDAYYAAFKIPDLMFGLVVVGSLSASFIPLFTKYYARPLSKQKAWDFANNTLHIVTVLVVIVSIVLMIFAEPLSGIIAPGFSLDKQMIVMRLFRVMLLAQIILAVSVIFGSVLQSLKRFTLYALSPILYNVGIIIGAVFFVDWLGVIGLAWGVVLGALLHLGVQTYGVLNSGYRYKFVWRLRDADTSEMIRLTGPRMLGIAINQIMFVILTIIATTLAAGSVTVFQFAYNIQYFPIGIIGVSYAIAAFPSFCEHVERRDLKRFIKTFSSTVRHILFFLIPMMMLFLILRAQIVRVVVGAGAFDWDATILTADTLAFFALTFVPQALIYVLARAFFAFHDTVTPLTAGIVATITGLMGALWFSTHFGVIGLGIAFSVASIVNIALLWVPLRQRVGSLDELHIVQSLFKMSIAGIGAALVMQFMKPIVVQIISLDTFFGVFLQGLIAGGLGLVVYFAICYFLKAEELFDVLSGLKKKFLKEYKPQEAVELNSSSSS